MGQDVSDFFEQFQPVVPRLYAWTCGHLVPKLRRAIDPEDVLQEVYLRSYRTFEGFDPQRGSFSMWVFGIARNVISEVLRSAATQRHASVFAKSNADHNQLDGFRDEAFITVSRQVAQNESIEAFVAWLDGLPKDDRQLVTLRGLEGLPHAMIAERLGVSSDALEKRWQRVRSRLADRTVPDFLLP